jgi:hypothetical protein
MLELLIVLIFTMPVCYFVYLLHLSNKAVKEAELRLFEATVEYLLRQQLRKEPNYVAIYKEALTTNYRSTRSL